MPKHNPKSSNKSRITALAVAVIILVVGVVTFILFRPDGMLNRQAQQGADTTQPAKSEPPIAETPSTDIDDKRYLVLEEWGVRFEVPEGLEGVRYYKTSDNLYQFTTQRVEALGDICDEPNDRGTDASRLGGLGRTTKPDWNTDENPPLGGGAIEGYYYYYQGAQSICSTRDVDAQYQDKQLIESMIKSLGRA